jgi:putative ABC transport system permease protein
MTMKHVHYAGCGCGHLASRRAFLAGSVAAVTGVTVANHGWAQAPARTLIDTHHHFYPPEYQKAFNDWEDARKLPRTAVQSEWTREKAVEAMDANGIRVGLISLPSTAGLWFNAGPEGAAKMVRICNDFGAQMVRDYPGRFGLLATLSMLDIDVTMKEIEYAFDTLKADGVGLQTNYGDKWLGDAVYRPVFDELNRKNRPRRAAPAGARGRHAGRGGRSVMRVLFVRARNVLKVGLRAIVRNKMRSALTMLGIVIGVACVIAMIAVASGASRSIQSSITSLGTNFIMIFPGAVTQSGARIFTGQSTLTVDDADAIRTECPSVAYVSPGVRSSGQAVAGEFNWGTSVQGVGIDWPFIRAWNLESGSFFTDADVRAGSKVCVLGRTVADNLFPGGGAVGQSLRIKNVPFRIVGVLERKGGSTMGQDQDDLIVAPYSTVMKRLMGSPRINNVFAAAVQESLVSQAQREIEALLRQRHRIGPGQDSDFMMRSQEEIASMAQQSTKTLSLLLGSVAGISLLVGGIGIMNIMLVSVTERTREIGIRMAIGAKGRHVMAQFLVEAVLLSVTGGAIGALLGIAASRTISALAGWPVEISPASVAVAFGFAALVGIFFGYYPALKASRLDPIEALRYE